MKYLAYVVIVLLHVLHIAAITGCLTGIILSDSPFKSLYFLFLGIVWAIMYCHIDQANPIKWANKVILESKK